MNINLRIEDKKSSYLELHVWDINSPDIAYMNIYNKVNSNNNIYLLKKKNWSEDDTNFLFIFFSVTKLWTLFKSFRDEYFWYFIMLISSKMK